MNTFLKQIMAICIVVASAQVWSASVIGHWQTIDDDTEEPKSVVELYEKDGKLFGKVTDLLIKPDDTVCKECRGDLKDQLIVGMDIVTGLTLKGEAYEGGEILDPENGKTYDAKIWLDGEDTLKVRGYLGIFFRTQTWHRTEPVPAVVAPKAETVETTAIEPTAVKAE